jgi:glycosyltransferase involved in cell wall biosynthesis
MQLKNIKKILKFLGLYSFIVLSYDKIIYKVQFLQLKKRINKISSDNKVFFFFPFYHTGGAELVHLNIIKSLSGQSSVTFFTLPSAVDKGLKDAFFSSSLCFDIQLFIRNDKDRKSIAKQIAKKINLQKTSVVFACHASFFYFLLPFLQQHVIRIDLIHAFTGENEPGHEKESLPFLNQITKRVVITKHVKNQLIELYNNKSIEPSNGDKIQVIYNATDLVSISKLKKSTESFTLLYVGRNSPEKRVHLIGKIASNLKSIYANINVVLIGPNLESAILQEDKENCIFIGALAQNQLSEWYEKAHAVLITSVREGFPMVFMESMVFGCVPVSTAVGGIPELLKHKENGLLIPNSDDDDTLINRFTNEVLEIIREQNLYTKLSQNDIDFATKQFTMKRFKAEYRKLLSNEQDAA